MRQKSFSLREQFGGSATTDLLSSGVVCSIEHPTRLCLSPPPRC
jgi:hypothetical protein